jgi:hypothetical protein
MVPQDSFLGDSFIRNSMPVFQLSLANARHKCVYRKRVGWGVLPSGHETVRLPDFVPTENAIRREGL